MKKLRIIALALAASLVLSACAEGTNEGGDDNKSGQHDIFDVFDTSDVTPSTSSNIPKPINPEIPDIEPISPAKLEYEFINNGEYGSGIKINAINTAAADIRIPDTIDGEPVVYLNGDLKYSENVKTLILPDSLTICGFFPESVEYIKLPQNLKGYQMPRRGYPISIFSDCKNLKEVWLPDTLKMLPASDAFESCPKDLIFTYKGKKYTIDNFPTSD